MASSHTLLRKRRFPRWSSWHRRLRARAKELRVETPQDVWTPISPEKQQEHARLLAIRHRGEGTSPCESLLREMEANAEFLDQVACLAADTTIPSCVSEDAAEWLIENRSFIREQVKVVRRSLGRRPRPEYPHVCDEAGGRIPRLYEIAWELVSHASHPLDQESVEAFVAAYQETAILKLGELCSLPDMLRVALIEILARLAGQVLNNQETRLSPLLGIRNAISSLHAVEDVSPKELVESQSIVERILREDPAGAYAQMDFDSCDYCRHAVEEIARGTSFSEEEVAALAIDLACQARSSEADSSTPRRSPEEHKQRHVGYYLLDHGRPLLEHRLEYKPSGRDALKRIVLQRPLACYMAAITVGWLLGVGAFTAAALYAGLSVITHPVSCLVLFLTFAVASTQCAVNLVNWFASLILEPRPVLRLDFSKGIPASCRTLVAVPAMLTDAKAVDTLVRQLELRYLGNRDKNLCFALLTDFPDASRPTLPGDDRLLRLARSQIERLNATYCRDRGSIFYLLHRKRKWNPQEGVWMGKERKRGKLMDLNRLLLAGDHSAFQTIQGDLEPLKTVRYVITLDADTRLPPDSGRQLVGCMAHPLNRPCIDPTTGLVVEGYAVLQPRVTISISDAHRSIFGRLLAGDAGLDPYTRYVSNLYQDAFGQGSFIGKGIYDVHAFSAALDGRFPENRILSHDLIEGCFARSGSANDIELFEGVPSRVLAEMSRRHRWVRGDWQIASWLLPHTISAHGAVKNPLPALARWKIFDNLRRSLTPFFLVLFMIAACMLAPGLAWLWLPLVALLLLGPLMPGSLLGLLRKPEEKPLTLHLKDQMHKCLDALLFEAVGWCLLPYVAHCHLDASLRALYRLRYSRRHLLEWTTASEAESHSAASCRDHYEIMWSCVVLSLSLECSLAIAAPWALLYLGPALGAWLLGPAIAWRISQPSKIKDALFADAAASQVGRWARQTWHFFETHVNESGLPPDHVQEHPQSTVARLTSPTNIGMGLLADLAAGDLAYLSPDRLLRRAQRTLHTMAQLEKYHGHFYNWYDIQTLEVVQPYYISSVDSGNLWGSLLVLHAGLQELRDRPIVPPRLFQGLQDTLQVIAKVPIPLVPAPSMAALQSCLNQLLGECSASPPTSAQCSLEKLRRICQLAATLSSLAPARDHELKQWTCALTRQCTTACRELSTLLFWKDWGRKEVSALRGQLAPIRQWCDELDRDCTLRRLFQVAEQVAARIDRVFARRVHCNNEKRQVLATLARLRDRACRAAATIRAQWAQISTLTDSIEQMCAMDFGFLFDPRRKALAVGYDVTLRKRDQSHYDLIASESRLTSFLAISHGQLPKEHWLALGRMVTLAGGKFGLLSWSGSMFEYLMPMLIMATHPGTLLESACKTAVRSHIAHGRRRWMPWGISESCCFRAAPDQSYHYQAFGVPELGLSPSLAEHPVVAPYASALAMMIAPDAAMANLARIEELGGLSPCGFYDAIDYSVADPHSKTAPAICRTVMAHHSGMALLAMSHSLLGDTMRRRFMANPRCEAYDILLQERIPCVMRLADRPPRSLRNRRNNAPSPLSLLRRIQDAHRQQPRTTTTRLDGSRLDA